MRTATVTSPPLCLMSAVSLIHTEPCLSAIGIVQGVRDISAPQLRSALQMQPEDRGRQLTSTVVLNLMLQMHLCEIIRCRSLQDFLGSNYGPPI